MYQTDAATGETVFEMTEGSGARDVTLEGFSEAERLRVPMRRASEGWTARVAVQPGWFFYRFCVDGRTRSDRGAGRLRSTSGEVWSLALINGSQVCPRHGLLLQAV